MTDPIADMLTRIRNAYLARKQQVSLPYSQIKQNLAKILKDHHYLKAVSLEKKSPQTTLKLTLNYIKGIPAVNGIERLSKPGRRLYVRTDKIKPVLSGHGISVVSTSQGLMTGKQAKQLGIGGELICKVW